VVAARTRRDQRSRVYSGVAVPSITRVSIKIFRFDLPSCNEEAIRGSHGASSSGKKRDALASPLFLYAAALAAIVTQGSIFLTNVNRLED